ncbi:hypothetical protein ACL2XP_00865 [Sodalis sp. RH21]|uniref:hypothetical protein n=1 Tax=unclassified Sodalis (in: enterobacteria) TaxID=2636512 RepID=UPI0039B404FD
MNNAWVWRWLARPWWVLAAAQAAVVTLPMAAILRHGQGQVAQLRGEIERSENVLRQHRRAQAAFPDAQRLDGDIARMTRQLAAYDTLRRDPGALIAAIRPGDGGKIAWHAAPDGQHPAPCHWSVVVVTDYRGLCRTLQNLAALGGGRTLRSLDVTPREGRLRVEFTLALTAQQETNGNE